MAENIRERLMSDKRCTACGLTDEHGGADFAGNGLHWYCAECLSNRDEAALRPSQRVTISYL